MIHCDEDETLQHLLLDCYQTTEIRNQMVSVGFNIQSDIKSIMFGLFKETFSDSKRRLKVNDVCYQYTHLENRRQSRHGTINDPQRHCF